MQASFAVLAAGLALATPGLAQQSPPPQSPPPQPAQADTWQMPYERGFWGHAGLSFGQSKFDDCPSGISCEDKDQLFKAYAGGRFNNAFGLELGVINFGKFPVGGGEIDGWGADVALIAGIPIGANSSIFAKAGVVYSRMEVTGTTPSLQSGKERGWGGRYGVGAQLGLNPAWALRADYDRYEAQLPGDHQNIDALTLGVQYTFR